MIDPQTQVPQLVVALRYDGAEESTPEPSVIDSEADADATELGPLPRMGSRHGQHRCGRRLAEDDDWSTPTTT